MPVEFQVDQTLDCKGLCCPLPILKAKKALDQMTVGQVDEVIGKGGEKDGRHVSMRLWFYLNHAGFSLWRTDEKGGAAPVWLWLYIGDSRDALRSTHETGNLTKGG